VWEKLDPPWQASLELAWEAYCDDCYPIGAVVTDENGKILTRGRNRIYEKRTRHGRERGNELAHAEVEALRALDFPAIDPHTCILYTTTEPCPMCMGTFYMSGLRTLHFASRDPYAGSVNLLGKTWYLSRKPIKVTGPDPLLEPIVVALFVEQDVRIHSQELSTELFWEIYRGAIPNGVEFGLDLARKGTLQDLRKRGASTKEMIDSLLYQVK
jgi:tRNA(adenine34) deaminase